MQQPISTIARYIPTLGLAVYLVLYVFATLYYPGGSQVNADSIGFDWSQNYWCNLLSSTAINGQPNAAQPFAIAGAIVLSICLSVFFFQAAHSLLRGQRAQNALKIFGSLTMLLSILLFTPAHDLVLSLLTITGSIALWLLGRGLYLRGNKLYQYWGMLCLLLVALNNAVYYSLWMIDVLPLLQKITFVVAMAWIIGLSWSFSSLSR